jgi:hypothetical protein
MGQAKDSHAFGLYPFDSSIYALKTFVLRVAGCLLTCHRVYTYAGAKRRHFLCQYMQMPCAYTVPRTSMTSTPAGDTGETGKNGVAVIYTLYSPVALFPPTYLP